MTLLLKAGVWAGVSATMWSARYPRVVVLEVASVSPSVALLSLACAPRGHHIGGGRSVGGGGRLPPAHGGRRRALAPSACGVSASLRPGFVAGFGLGPPCAARSRSPFCVPPLSRALARPGLSSSAALLRGLVCRWPRPRPTALGLGCVGHKYGSLCCGLWRWAWVIAQRVSRGRELPLPYGSLPGIRQSHYRICGKLPVENYPDKLGW